MYNNIGIIGCGNMGRAICERLKDRYPLMVFDKESAKLKDLSNIKVTNSSLDLVSASDAVILAVKPQDFDNLLSEIKANIKDQLVISIAAGITTGYIEKILGNAKIIRVMPNMPAKIGQGMSCLCRGRSASEEDLNFAKELFDKLGKTLIINENMMDAATAVSGSGPGYFYYLVEGKNKDEIKRFAEEEFISNFIASASKVGFSRDEAELLAKTTVEGSIALLEQTKLNSSELKKQVASKKGTTEAGLEVLHKGGSLEDAVKAALKRSKELSKKG